MARFRAERAAALLVAVLGFLVSRSECQVICYDSVDEFCLGATNNATTIVDCCLGDGISFEFEGGERCFACIVFGWLNGTTLGSDVARLSLREQLEPYELSVGFIKGTSAVNRNLQIKFNVIVQHGNATIGTDFSLNTTSVETNTTAPDVPVELSILDDEIALELSESFSLSLIAGNMETDLFVAGGDVFIIQRLEITILESEVGEVSVGFEQPLYRVLEGMQSVTVCVVKDSDTAVPVQVEIRDTPGSAGNPGDYIFNAPQTVTLNLTESRDCISISIIDDGDALEGPEDFTLQLTQATPSAVAIGQMTTRVIIEDNDNLTIGFGLPSLLVAESDGRFTMCVVKSGNTTSPLSVSIAVTDITAIRGLDYRLSTIPETVTIGPTEDRVCFTGIIINDVLGLEGDEDFRLTLVDPTPGSVAIGQETTTITIRDDDVVPVRFLQSDYTVLRSDDSVTVCLTKGIATATTVTVGIFTEDGTATDGLDYVGGLFTVTLSSSAAAVTCQSITILDPGQQTLEESFVVRLDLDLAPGRVIAGDPSFATVTITRGVEDDRFNCTTDIVMGDPLFTVPLRIDNLPSGGLFSNNSLPICYEVHGNPDRYYNLITSECVIVNARYNPATNDASRNIIDRIAIRAVHGTTGQFGCQDIIVSLDGCSVSPIAATAPGIDIRRMSQSSVGITVPNCDDKELAMQIDCETQPRDMLRFQVTRGLNGGHVNTHGLLGQFWNNPARLFKFEGESAGGIDFYSVEIANVGPNSGDRTFTGDLVGITWAGVPSLCLYVGNRQAGPIFEVVDPNDPVIEGDFELYETQGPFSDVDSFGRFDTGLCS